MPTPIVPIVLGRFGASQDTAGFVAADATGMSFPNDGNQVLEWRNDDAAVIRTADITGVPGSRNGATPVQTFSPPINGGYAAGGRFLPSEWNDANGLVQITIPDDTALFVRVLTLALG